MLFYSIQDIPLLFPLTYEHWEVASGVWYKVNLRYQNFYIPSTQDVLTENGWAETTVIPEFYGFCKSELLSRALLSPVNTVIQIYLQRESEPFILCLMQRTVFSSKAASSKFDYRAKMLLDLGVALASICRHWVETIELLQGVRTEHRNLGSDSGSRCLNYNREKNEASGDPYWWTGSLDYTLTSRYVWQVMIGI